MQTKVREDHQWLTAFVCDEGLFEWVRTPFGMKSSSATCVRAIQQILRPLKRFTDSYVDDMTVFSDQWRCHLHYLTEASPKSAKLMRWALAIQEFNVRFQYKAGNIILRQISFLAWIRLRTGGLIVW